MNHRLILIDGISGSGKTTTARWLAEALGRRGVSARAWTERDEPHPLNGWWTWDDGFTPPDRVEAPFDADRFTSRIVANGRAAVSHLLNTGQTYVIEGYPFQLAVRIHLKMGATREQIERYFASFQEAVAPAEPLLLFLDPPDMERTFRQACAERGAAFEDRFIGQIARSPIGRARGLEGWDGLVRFHAEYAELTRHLLARWRFHSEIYHPTAQDWDSVRSEIAERCVG